MDGFKFFERKKTNQELLEIIHSNFFAISFIGKQLMDMFNDRHYYRIIDSSNEYRTFKMMLIDRYYSNSNDIEMGFVVYDGINYILCYGLFNNNGDLVGITKCEECTTESVNSYTSKKNVSF